MSRCELRIKFDDPGRTYRSGDTVSGQVEIALDKEARCKALTVKRQWRTHGKGNSVSGGGEGTTLFSGEWPANTSTSYPFSFTAPSRPITYHGHHLNVDW